MALITPQSVTVTGLAPVFSAPTASDTMAPADRRIYVVRTTGTATNVVIVVPGNNKHGQANPDVTFAVGATSVHVINLAGYVDDATAGVITVTHSGALTGVTSCLLSL
jgi:hypothetical protein